MSFFWQFNWTKMLPWKRLFNIWTICSSSVSASLWSGSPCCVRQLNHINFAFFVCYISAQVSSSSRFLSRRGTCLSYVSIYAKNIANLVQFRTKWHWVVWESAPIGEMNWYESLRIPITRVRRQQVGRIHTEWPITGLDWLRTPSKISSWSSLFEIFCNSVNEWKTPTGYRKRRHA